MGRYQNGNYYRDQNDGELQWLEDGVGFVAGAAVGSVILILSGIFKLFNALLGQDSD